MKQDLIKENNFNRSYERSMNHNYMILSKCNFFDTNVINENDFRVKMLLENNIKGLLPVSFRQINGEDRYYYEINSLQAFDRFYDHKEMRYAELKALLTGCANMFDRLEEYLLDGNQIIIKSDYIYIDVETFEPFFVCYPEYTGDVRLAFMQFIDELLTKLDHTDQYAVMLGYQVYRYTRNPNFVISEIKNMIEHTIVEVAGSQMNPAKSIQMQNNQMTGVVQSNMVRNFGSDNSGFKTVEANNVNNSFCSNNSNNSYQNNQFKKTDFQSEDFKNKNSSVKNISSEDFSNKYLKEFYHNQEVLSEQATQTKDSQKQNSKTKKKSKSDLIGAIFCVFVALAAAAMVLGAKVLLLFKLDSNQEMYLYGAFAMSAMAAVIFAICFIKSGKQERIIEELENEEDDDADCYLESGTVQPYFDNILSSENTNNISNSKTSFENFSGFENNFKTFNSRDFGSNRNSGETVCLSDEVIEERMLRGRVNGKDMSISLDKLPMTIGKLAGVSDIEINDNAVSKVHARFEEQNGRVFLRDLNSTNGTVHNGEAIDINATVLLEPGDRIRVGRTSFMYC